MVRPEPHPAFNKADLRADCSVKSCLCFVEEDLPRHRHWLGLPCHRGRHLWLRRHLVLHARVLAAVFREFLRRLAAPSRELVLRGSLGIEFENRPVSGAAAGQVGSGDQPSARLIELGHQRALRIGRDRFDRADARSKAEPVQCQCSRSRVADHRPRPYLTALGIIRRSWPMYPPDLIYE